MKLRIALVGVLVLLVAFTVRLAIKQHSPGVGVPTVDELLAVTTSPRLPDGCKRLGHVAFVAVPPLTTLDLEALAERYRRVYGLDVQMLPSISAERVEAAFDRERQQYDGARLLAAFAPIATTPPWVIGVTDRDMFWPGSGWRFAFLLHNGSATIISTAHTQPGRARSAERVMKLISRSLGLTYCGLARGGPRASVLSSTLGGLDDLDAIDESVWIPRTGAPD